MDRYLVISPHTEKDCATALKQLLYIGYITHFDWGCMVVSIQDGQSLKQKPRTKLSSWFRQHNDRQQK
jgi:hypothetical protein